MTGLSTAIIYSKGIQYSGAGWILHDADRDPLKGGIANFNVAAFYNDNHCGEADFNKLYSTLDITKDISVQKD